MSNHNSHVMPSPEPQHTGPTALSRLTLPSGSAGSYYDGFPARMAAWRSSDVTRVDHRDLRNGSWRSAADADAYVHLAASVAPRVSSAVKPGSAELREMVGALRGPVARVAEGGSVISARLFRNAWLSALADVPVADRQPHGLVRYDIAILIRVGDPDRVGQFLDEDALRNVLEVLHTRGRDVVITPARNVGVASAAQRGRMSLIHHVLAPDTDAPDTWAEEGGECSREPWVSDRELLIPLHPDSTPLRSIHRAEIDDVRARALVTTLLRPGADRGVMAPARNPAVLPHLYWELSGGAVIAAERGRGAPSERPLYRRDAGGAGDDERSASCGLWRVPRDWLP